VTGERRVAHTWGRVHVERETATFSGLIGLAATRWTTHLSSKVVLAHAINFKVQCGRSFRFFQLPT
jgi:hypothetical protein